MSVWVYRLVRNKEYTSTVIGVVEKRDKFYCSTCGKKLGNINKELDGTKHYKLHHPEILTILVLGGYAPEINWARTRFIDEAEERNTINSHLELIKLI